MAATAFSSLAFSISPCAKPKGKKNQEDDETYLLTLAPFTRPPKISFGTVKVNEAVEKSLLIMNPQDFGMELNVVNSDLNINNIKLFIEKGETVALKLKWEPTKPDNYRYTINFEVLNSLKLKFVVHAYGVCEKIDLKKKPAARRAPFKVLQPIKSKKEEEEAQKKATSAAPAPEKTLVIKSTASNQENRPAATASLTVHNRTHLVEKPKSSTTAASKANTFRYDDDFYRGEFNYNPLLDVSSAASMSTAGIGAHHAANSTVIDRRQTSVISTPKLNFYRSIDSINLASDHTIGMGGGTYNMKSPLRRSTSVREIYMEETIIKANHSTGLSATAEDADTTLGMLPDAVASLMSSNKLVPQSPGTPKLADYLRTPCAKGRQWTLAHEQDRTAKYAVICQRAVRMKRFRLRLRILKLSIEQTRAALVVQRQWRIKMFRRRMRRFRRAALVIQRWFRHAIVARRQKQLEVVERQIMLDRAQLYLKVRSAKKIQRWYREILRRRAEHKRRLEAAVVSVQSQWRMIVARRRFDVKVKAVKAIQGWYRVKRAQRMLRELKRNKAALTIQSQWRMILARRVYQSKVKSARLIQNTVRGMAARERFVVKKKQNAAAILIQSKWRMYVARREFRINVKRVVKIQRWYRAILKRRAEHQMRLEKAVLSVQSQWRMIVARRRFEVKVKAVKAIQGWYRVKRAQRVLREKRRNKAAVTIQSQWKMILARRQFQLKLKSAKLIQTRWRGVAARRRFEHTKKLHAAVLTVQTRWRGVQARRHLAEVRAARQAFVNKCATRIQATWRGYVARKRYNEQQQMRAQQLRLLRRSAPNTTAAAVTSTAADSTTKRTLGARIQSSLRVLNCPDVSIPLVHIIAALNDLNTVTRLSPECCEIFVNESATDILFGFIANCNRSVPHMDMIKLCLDILLNLARYSRTVAAVTTHPASFPTLVNLLAAYQLSNPVIFMNVCVIVLLMSRHGSLTDTQMALVGGRDKLAAKLVGMHMTLEKRRQASSRTGITAGTSSAADSSSSSSSSSSSRGGSAASASSKRVVFALEPDWQLGRMTQTIEFTDALNALDVLINELGMRHVLASSSSAVVSSSSKSRGVVRRDAQTPTATHHSHSSNRSGHATAASRRIDYAASTSSSLYYSSSSSSSQGCIDPIVEHSTTIISNDHNSSMLSNITIRSAFNEEPHLNSTRNHF